MQSKIKSSYLILVCSHTLQIRVGQEEVENADGNEDTSVPQLQRVETNDGSVSSGRSFRRTVRRASADGILDKKLSRSEYRAKIVEEIVGTERTYVKYLEDVVEVRVYFEYLQL